MIQYIINQVILWIPPPHKWSIIYSYHIISVSTTIFGGQFGILSDYWTFCIFWLDNHFIRTVWFHDNLVQWLQTVSDCNLNHNLNRIFQYSILSIFHSYAWTSHWWSCVRLNCTIWSYHSDSQSELYLH